MSYTHLNMRPAPPLEAQTADGKIKMRRFARHRVEFYRLDAAGRWQFKFSLTEVEAAAMNNDLDALLRKDD